MSARIGHRRIKHDEHDGWIDRNVYRMLSIVV
jgi:hypothetical protein